MIIFRISTGTGVPPYLQLVQQVQQALQVGLLQIGDRLPTAKEVVAMVAINPNTVAKAYRELEQQGIVKGKAGVGTTIIKRPHGPAPATQIQLGNDLEQWVTRARAAGLDTAAIESLVRVVINKGGNHEPNSNR